MQNGNAGGESVPGVDEQITKARAAPDWEAIRADYIAGMSYDALTSKYGIRKETIHKRGTAERWADLRAEENGGPVRSVRPVPDTPEPFAELTGPQASALTADTLARRALKLARENEDDRILEAAARIMSRAHQVMMEQGRIDGGGVRVVIDLPDGCGD